jgi:hypothetical protein
MPETNEAKPTSYAADVKPLFTETDQEHMSFMFDLWSYDDVKEHADGIYGAVSDGSMPPGDPWSADQVATFKAWMAGGYQP